MEIGNSLVDGWNNFWGNIPMSGGITVVLSIVGGAIMAFFLIKFFWQKSRGGGGGAMQGFPWWPMLIGLLLTAPAFLIPFVLNIVQVIINLVTQLLDVLTGNLGG
jgi:hypothetical protein